MQNELSERGRLFLHRPLFAVLATKDPDGYIYQCYMWYMLVESGDGDYILLNTTRHRPQYHNIVNDPGVSLCIGAERRPYQYITIVSRCRIIDDEETAKRDILALATRYDGEKAAQWFYEKFCVSQERVSLYVPIEGVREHWGADNRKVVEGW